MIDGRGRARITDFGLAASAAESSRHRGISGTPGYMSPEQARGEAVTTAADIYALGIVLYEIFTGRQAFDALSSAELIAMNASGVPPAAPSTIVPDIDHHVEWTILQCLHADPAKRPSSARQVLASLPARDVLEAAIAAGETPLPEVVAAAGSRGNLKTPIAALLVAVTLIGTAAGVALRSGSDHDRLLRQLKSPEALRDRSAELAARLAPASSVDADEYFGYVENETLVASLASVPGPDRWKPLVDRPHDAMLFWYRRGVGNAPSYFRNVSFDDPPHIEPGSVSLLVDGAGRLRRFRHVPAGEPAVKPVNWQTWFADAGLDMRAFAPTAVPRTGLPAVPADRIDAWQSRDLLIVGGTRGGVPVFFEVLTPLERESAAAPTAEGIDAVGIGFGTILALIGVGALLLARRNLNRGRVDRRGAWVLALFVFVTFTVSWLTSASIAKVLEGIAYGVLASVVAWLAYVALEPFVRRRWPATLVGWSRLVQRRPGDPHVGRDILIGLAAAAASRVIVNLAAVALERSGTPDTAPTGLRILPSARAVASELFYNLFLAVLMTLCFLFLLYAITLVVRRRSIAVAAVCLVLLLLFAIDGGVAVIGLIAALLVIDRFGLLAGIAMMYGSFLQAEIITFDLDRWYAGSSTMAMAILVALTVYAAGRAKGGTALRASQ